MVAYIAAVALLLICVLLGKAVIYRFVRDVEAPMNAAEARELAAAFDAVPRPNQICSDARHKSVQHQAVVLLEEYNQIMTLPADERLVALVSFQAKAKAWKNFKAKTHPAAEAAGQADVIPLFCQ